MTLTYDEAQKTSGRFFEYEYETTVIRNDKSKHFGCFKDNDNPTFRIVQKVYCTSDKWFDYIMSKWEKAANGLLSMYSYKGLGRTCEQSFTAMQVVERKYKDNNYKYLAYLDDLTGCFIQ